MTPRRVQECVGVLFYAKINANNLHKNVSSVVQRPDSVRQIDKGKTIAPLISHDKILSIIYPEY